MLSKEDIKQTLLENKAKIITFGVKRIGLFGSFARNEQHAESDLDFLVEYLPGQKNFHNFMNLAFLLEDTFNRKVDLITPESMSKYIYPYVLKEVEYVSLVA